MRSFVERNVLDDHKIGLADSRPAADSAWGGADAAQKARIVTAIHDRIRAVNNPVRRVGRDGGGNGRILRETVGIEIVVPIALRVQPLERSELVGLARVFRSEEHTSELQSL